MFFGKHNRYRHVFPTHINACNFCFLNCIDHSDTLLLSATIAIGNNQVQLNAVL